MFDLSNLKHEYKLDYRVSSSLGVLRARLSLGFMPGCPTSLAIMGVQACVSYKLDYRVSSSMGVLRARLSCGFKPWCPTS